ncbi:MAG: transcriptional regulator [Nitrososphaerota archaeon]
MVKMGRDQVLGFTILLVSLVGIVVYSWLLFFTNWDLIILKLTAFVAVTGLLALIAWIGYTLATTPPPKPIEEIEKELEKELETEKKE